MDSEKNTKGDHFEITDETGSALKKKAKLNDSNPKVTSQLDDEEEEKQVEKKHEPKNLPRTDSPYLGTIQRHMLDFDFEKLCSVKFKCICLLSLREILSRPWKKYSCLFPFSRTRPSHFYQSSQPENLCFA